MRSDFSVLIIHFFYSFLKLYKNANITKYNQICQYNFKRKDLKTIVVQLQSHKFIQPSNAALKNYQQIVVCFLNLQQLYLLLSYLKQNLYALLLSLCPFYNITILQYQKFVLITFKMGNQCCTAGDKITIKTEKQQFQIPGKTDSKITEIKSAISQKKKIALSMQILSYNGHQLTDDQTLQQYKFDPKVNKLSLLIANDEGNTSQPITVTIKNINFTTNLQVNLNQTVGDLKRKIQQKQNFPIKEQRIIFNRAILHDLQQLRKYGIQQGSIIHLARVLTC